MNKRMNKGTNTDTIVKARSFLDGDEDQHEKDVFEKNLKKNLSTKRLGNVEQQPGSERPSQLPVLDAVHEVVVYIHRFHNLDLF
ncbi:hypothetical protein S83_071076 [Arachis hypogaea]